jgi:prepilin-type N-terminal cleavage/methylation domain-containing protein
MGGKRFSANEAGFTLIELMAVIFLSGVIMAAIYSLFVSQNVTFSAQEQMNEMTQNLRVSMDQMSREIRLAGYKNSTSTFNGIATAQPATIRILADLNQDGDTVDDDEDITYSYDADTMQIWRNSPGLPIADHITNLSFTYTLADGTTTSNPASLANIRKVTISITAQTAKPDLRTGLYRTFSLTSDVMARNLAL